MRKIYVVGSINRDLVVYVDGLPRPGETVFGNRFQQFPGGKGANQAVAASRLGGNVHLVGNVGADPFGKEMRDFLAGENIDTSEIAILDTAPTGIALITVDSASENSIVVVSGANMVWHTRELARLKVEPGDIVVCQFEIPLEIIESAFARAKEIGATTILNPAPVQAVPERILTNVNYLVVNEVELEALSGASVDLGDPASVYAAMGKLHQRVPLAIVATLGSRGALLSGPSGDYEAKGYNVNAVDTTGAGDCFIGAFAAALAQSDSISHAIDFANKAAAISVTRRGAASSFPTAVEVDPTAEERILVEGRKGDKSNY
jgi:ribokinase